MWSFCDVFFHFCVFIASISFTISFTSISAREVNLQWKERGEGLLDTWNYNLNAHCCELSSSNIAQKLILGVKYIKDPTTNGGAPPMTRGVDPPLQRVPRKLKWIAKISKEMPPFVGGCLSECGACNLTYFTHNINILGTFRPKWNARRASCTISRPTKCLWDQHNLDGLSLWYHNFETCCYQFAVLCHNLGT